MKNKAPDTRNKLDSNRDLNKNTKKNIKDRKKPVIVLRSSSNHENNDNNHNATKPNNNNSLNINSTNSLNNISERSPKIQKAERVKKPSNGAIFKKNTGYSKSMKRAMNNAGVYTMEEYRIIRKDRKKKLLKSSQEKRSLSRAKRLSSGKTKTKTKKGKKGK